MKRNINILQNEIDYDIQRYSNRQFCIHAGIKVSPWEFGDDLNEIKKYKKLYSMKVIGKFHSSYNTVVTVTATATATATTWMNATCAHSQSRSQSHSHTTMRSSCLYHIHSI